MDKRLKEYIKNKEDIFVSSKGSYFGPYVRVPKDLVERLKRKDLIKPVGACLNGRSQYRLLWQSYDGSLPSIKVSKGVLEGYTTISNFALKNKLKSSDMKKLHQAFDGSSNFLLATYGNKGGLYKTFKEDDLNSIIGIANGSSDILFKDTDNKKDFFIFYTSTSNEEALKKLGFNLKRSGSSAVRNFEVVKVFDDGKVQFPLQLWQKKGGPLPKLSLPTECPEGYTTKVYGYYIGHFNLAASEVRKQLATNGVSPIYVKKIGRGGASTVQRGYPWIEVEKAVKQLREQWKGQKVSSMPVIPNSSNNKKETLIGKIKSFWSTLSSKLTSIKSNKISEDIIKI